MYEFLKKDSVCLWIGALRGVTVYHGGITLLGKGGEWIGEAKNAFPDEENPNNIFPQEGSAFSGGE